MEAQSSRTILTPNGAGSIRLYNSPYLVQKRGISRAWFFFVYLVIFYVLYTSQQAMLGPNILWHNNTCGHTYDTNLSRKMDEMEKARGPSPEEHT